MVELKYPRGWSFADKDTLSPWTGTAAQKYASIQKQLKYRLDRDLYIQARTYSEGPAHGGIDRFIQGVRVWFSITEILDGKFDGILDSDPRNRIVPTTPLPVEIPTNDDIVTSLAWWDSLDDIAKDLNKSLSTIKRWKNVGRVVEVNGQYYQNDTKKEDDDGIPKSWGLTEPSLDD